MDCFMVGITPIYSTLNVFKVYDTTPCYFQTASPRGTGGRSHAVDGLKGA